ncbi:eukaryotic translation initiation factor 4 gamma-like [Lathyrus oleraceus]|uniref:eukaryotic translation initiation factor 4 gamma-like n=1 Tax=Pisum sativum TaxID=3888 RepID=UPI0021D386B9|nr:eukaryotic translation initiation factor 4 gamma-like [Pisum sativum]
MSQHPSPSGSKTTKPAHKARTPSMDFLNEDILDVIPVGQNLSSKKSVSSPTANASQSKKHDSSKEGINLEDESSEDEDDSLLHHLKPSVAKRMKTRKGRGTKGACELEATDNEVCREVTAKQVKEWPRKKHLHAGKLTMKYVILHKIGDAEIRLQERLAREAEERARQETEEKARQEELQRIREAEAKALADAAATEAEAKAKADAEEAARLAKESAAKARANELTQGESSNAGFVPLVLKTLEELQKEQQVVRARLDQQDTVNVNIQNMMSHLL